MDIKGVKNIHFKGFLTLGINLTKSILYYLIHINKMCNIK